MKIQGFIRTTMAAAALCASQVAWAGPGLIGETLSFLRAYPNTTTQYLNSIPDTTVVAGPSDAVSWVGTTTTLARFDPEETGIAIGLATTTYVNTLGTFDGFVISGFDQDIDTFSVASNGSGFGVSLFAIDSRTLAIGLQGSARGGNVFVNIGLVSPPVPEPGTVGLMALGLGLIAVGARRRRAARQA